MASSILRHQAGGRAAAAASMIFASTRNTSTRSKSIQLFTESPRPTTARGWAERTPPGFEFSLKLFQKFTHPDMFLKATGGDPLDARSEGCRRFPHRHRPADGRGKAWRAAGAVPGQLPQRAGYACLPGVAARSVSRSIRVALELRHRSWSDQPIETLQMLDALRRCLGADRRTKVPIFDPSEPAAERPDLLLPALARPQCRDSGGNHDSSEDRYNYLYSADELRRSPRRLEKPRER